MVVKHAAILCIVLGCVAFQPAAAQSTRPPVVTAQPPIITETPASRALIRVDQLEAEMRTLTNRVEILEAELASQKEANLRLARLIDENRALAATANQAQAPTNGASEPTPAPTATDANPASSDTQAGSAPATLPASNEPTTPLPSAGGAVAAPAVTEPPKPSPVLLAEARMHIQRGEFQIAEAKLNEIAENHGDSPEAPEALWLLGETRFVQQAFAPAAQAYVAYLGKSPNGPRMPNAYVGLASAFRELGDNRQRCLALAEYTRRATNPTSVQRARADAEIARAPCP